MAEADDLTTWAKYIEAAVAPRGRSVAWLARRAGLHRSTVFDWKSLKVGDKRRVSLDSVKAVAAAIGDDLENALDAAGNLVDADELDIRRQPAPDDAESADMVDLIYNHPTWSRRRKIFELERYLRLQAEAAREAGVDEAPASGDRTA